MRTSKMTSLLGVLSATVLAVAVAGSVVPASAAIRMGGGGFHGGGFGRPTLAAGLIAGSRIATFVADLAFGDSALYSWDFPGWVPYYGYYCSPYWRSVNPWIRLVGPAVSGSFARGLAKPLSGQSRKWNTVSPVG
jgi:hypothetical protein